MDVVHEPADQHISDDHKDHGDDRKPCEKGRRPCIDMQHVGHVFVEIIRQHRICQQRQRRSEQITDGPFRDQRHIVFPDQRWRQLVKDAAFCLLFHVLSFR